MTELEDFELIFRCLILFLSYLCVTEIVLIVRLYSPHYYWFLGLIGSHEGLIVLISRLLHIVDGLLHWYVLNLGLYISD